jgi:hypothetical protein
MRQYDRSSLIGKSVGHCHIGTEIRLFGLGHGIRLGGVCPWESRLAGAVALRRAQSPKFLGAAWQFGTSVSGMPQAKDGILDFCAPQ